MSCTLFYIWGGTTDYNSNPRHFTDLFSSKMTIFKENKDNLLPCSLKTEKRVGLQRSYLWSERVRTPMKYQDTTICVSKPLHLINVRQDSKFLR